MLRISQLYSGSKGNATLIEGAGVRVLVDAGGSAKRLELALQAAGCPAQELSGVLVTHEHSDHISALNIFAARYALPIYANEATHRAMAATLKNILPEQRIFVRPNSDFYIGALNIEAYCTSHDAACPQAYGFFAQGIQGALITDTGYIPRELCERITGARVVLLESNHDERMLLGGSYPAYLKKRIYGRKGHLSNDTCAETLSTLIEHGARHLMLMHLSDENNTPQCAQDTVITRLAKSGATAGKDYDLYISSQAQALPMEVG